MCKKLIYLTSFVLVLGLALPSAVEAADPDLVGWWKLNETSGTIASDSSGNGRDGALIGDPQWVPGQIAGALYVDGDGDAVDLGNEDVFNFPGSFSISVWANIEAWNQGTWHNVIVGKKGEGTSWQLRKHGGNDNLTFTIRGTSGPDDPQGTIVPTFGQWHHIVAIYDADAGTRTVYIDNVLDVQVDDSGNHSSDDTRVYIGARTANNNTDTASFFLGMIDDVYIFSRALTQDEIPRISKGLSLGLAFDSIPADEATDVPRDVVLSWTPGEFANTHNVYLGTVFDDVNDAVLADAVSAGQTATTYDPPGRLDFSQTYFWRIDEVNAPPYSTIYKGDTWSFTTEPIAYPIAYERITVTASSSAPGQGPENTLNDSGLDADDLHSAAGMDMWLTATGDPGPAWIQYEFDKVLKLREMWVWNHNTQMEPGIGFGIKDAAVEYSVDGTNWATLGTTHEFARAPGALGYAPNTTVDLEGAAAKYVKLTPNSNWGGILQQYGLSEVRFFSVPVLAREPSPDSGATDVDVNVILSWRAGRDAATHDVYLSTDEQAVIDGTAPVTTVTEASYTPSADLAETYYWRVDEVNDAETTTTWQGEIWKYSTQEYLVVDDFEAYNDIPAGEEGSNLVYETWIDGFANPSVNGSTVGYTVAFQSSLENSIVYDGRQSAPLFYDNTTAGYSEITANVANLQAGRDWTGHGIKALTLRFLGDPANAAQQMYVKINGSKVPYDGDAENLKRQSWQMWNIDLTSLGATLSNVTDLSIGFDRIGAAGGQGMVLLDAIRLYRSVPEVVGTTLIEDFDSLAVGSSMHDVPGWEGWFGDAQAGGRITDTVAYSGTNALEIMGTRDDLVPHWPLVDSGIYVATVMQYVPASTTSGVMYFAPLRIYGSNWDETAWMADLRTDCGAGLVFVNELDAGTRTEAPLIRDQWVQLRLVMNFDINNCDFYYGDVLLGSYECPSVQAFDIYPDGDVDVVYFDDFRFEAAE